MSIFFHYLFDTEFSLLYNDKKEVILMKSSIPRNVNYIIDIFNQNRFLSYVVGGCVRDCLLGITPSDWDICTSASPEDIKRLFKKTFDTGIKHGTVSVLIDDEIFEVTTFRCDGNYKDNRHPEKVSFTKSLHEDLARRDFTINAMAYNNTDGLIDYFGGQNDLKNNLIKCVGDPDKRFSEDSLRMLRAVRFAAQKGFEIENNTMSSICKNAHLVKNLSAERIISEVTKILISDNPKNIKLLYDLGILKYIMPEMCKCFETPQNIKWHIYDVGNHSLKAVEFTDRTPYLRFAALMHDWGKPSCKKIKDDGYDTFKGHASVSISLAKDFMERYKFKNSDKSKILKLIKYHDRPILPEKKYVKRAINDIGEDLFLDLLNLKRADCKAQNFLLTAPRLKDYEVLEKIYNDIKKDNETFSLKNLAVNGNDLKDLGYSGKEIGEKLNLLLNHVIDFPEDNKKEILIKILPKI